MLEFDVESIKWEMKEKVILLDTRLADDFTQGFIPDSIFIGLESRFAEWAAELLNFSDRIILVTEVGKEQESLQRLEKIGFKNIAGYLAGGYDTWQQAGEPIDLIIDIESDELMMDIPHDPHLIVIDVRRPTEFADGHLKDAVNIPLSEMIDPAVMAHIEDIQNLYIHSAGGYRSVIATSLLKRQGFHNLRNVIGGWEKIKEEKNIKIVKEKSVLN